MQTDSRINGQPAIFLKNSAVVHFQDKAEKMGRHSRISSLSTERRIIVDKCIRSNLYINLDRIMEELIILGVSGVSRSGLHRYLRGLKERDELFAQPDQGTIVTIVERGTGEVRVAKTGASGRAIAAMIEKIQSPNPD